MVVQMESIAGKARSDSRQTAMDLSVLFKNVQPDIGPQVYPQINVGLLVMEQPTNHALTPPM